MRIGLSTSVMQRGRSGVGQYILALVRGLLAEASGHEFTLFVLEADLPLFAFAASALNLVPVAERFRPAWSNILWHQLRLPPLARRLRLDVLHVPSYRRLLWSHPCALVATVHDLAPFRFPGKYDFRRMAYGRLIVPRLARRQDEIIAVSQFTATDVAAFLGRPRGGLRVIPNGLDHERFRPGPQAEAKSAWSQSRGLRQPFFLYVARLEHPAKNHARLIAAFNRFKAETRLPWQLVLSGSDWHGAAVVHELIRQSPFRDDIRSLGFVPDAELPALYRAADVFVFPSLFEGFGLPPLEAMACGCPVLASARGALGEAVGAAAAILDPASVTDIQRQMTHLAVDVREREDLRARGLAWAARFDWQRTAAATLEVYAAAGREVRSRSTRAAAWPVATGEEPGERGAPSGGHLPSGATVRIPPPLLNSR